MVSSKKRKTPVTGTGTKSRPSSAKTRSVIRKFHVLLKLRRKLEGQPGAERELSTIEEQINGLGGLDTYQTMSQQGQSAERGGGTETVLIDWLEDIVKENPLREGQKLRLVYPGAALPSGCIDQAWLRLLEVGALKADNYRGCRSWIENTPIDLNSKDPGVKQQDFLEMSEDGNARNWDVLSLSLVLNFVPDPKERGAEIFLPRIPFTLTILGRMLGLAHSFLDAAGAHSGLLFVAVGAIPPCNLPGKVVTDHTRVVTLTMRAKLTLPDPRPL